MKQYLQHFFETLDYIEWGILICVYIFSFWCIFIMSNTLTFIAALCIYLFLCIPGFYATLVIFHSFLTKNIELTNIKKTKREYKVYNLNDGETIYYLPTIKIKSKLGLVVKRVIGPYHISDWNMSDIKNDPKYFINNYAYKTEEKALYTIKECEKKIINKKELNPDIKVNEGTKVNFK